MKIAIIGTGNVGGALATKWALAGHTILLGVKDTTSFKGEGLLNNPNTTVHPIKEAVKAADVILIATPATAAVEVAQSLGDTRAHPSPSSQIAIRLGAVWIDQGFRHAVHHSAALADPQADPDSRAARHRRRAP